MSVKLYQIALGLLILCISIVNIQAQTVVDFDTGTAPADFEDQTTATDDYSNGFVTFSGPLKVLNLEFTPEISPPHALKWLNFDATSDTPITSEEIVTFQSPVENVSFRIGSVDASVAQSGVFVSVSAFDAAGVELSVKQMNVTGDLDEFVVAGTGIKQLVISLPAFSAGCIDDLTYTEVEVDVCSAYAGDDQTLYIGYPPLRTTSLHVEFEGGVGEKTYLWSTEETTATIHVCPEETTTYTVTVTDANGCSATDEVTIEVEDVRCGWYGKGVVMCYKGWNYCVRKRYVWSFYYYYGARIGYCNSNSRKDLGEKPEIDFTQFDGLENSEYESSVVKIYPNPATDYIIVDPGMFIDAAVQVSIFDVSGRVVSQSSFDNMGQERIDVSQFNKGIYHLRLEDLEGTSETHRFVIR